jgi:hypothetical protein
VAFSSSLEYVFTGLQCPFGSRSTCPAPQVARGSGATGHPIWHCWPLLDGYGVAARLHPAHVLIRHACAHRAAARPHQEPRMRFGPGLGVILFDSVTTADDSIGAQLTIPIHIWHRSWLIDMIPSLISPLG